MVTTSSAQRCSDQFLSYHMHVELHPQTPLALKAGPREPNLGLSIGGQAFGGISKGADTTTQTN